MIILRYNILQVRKRITRVKDFKEWESYARLLDHLEGNSEWKTELESNQYDYSRLEKRRQMMKQLRKSGNIKTLSHCLRQDLVKNIGNMSNPQLYNQCHLGTKKNIEKYMDEVIKSIKEIYHADTSKMTVEKKLTFFAETRHSYGKTALFLSGGASFGKWHFGFLRALYEQDLFPRILVGSSIGALMGCIICSKPYSEMP